MAPPSLTRGVKLLIKIGNGASPTEVFTALCSINAQRGITFNSQTNDETVPDCTDLEKIAWIVREVESLSVEVSGGGKANKPDVPKLFNWWKSGESKNIQIILDDATAANVITFAGAFKLTSFEVTGDRGGKAELTMSLASDGEVTGTFGANVTPS
ncbi:phage tail tube protein [Asticcacaulis excentricus]|uniref:Major tail protein TP901-1 n=1 Tax=Asticcacaulis excentricus (strain ATCC 15261 / DSM 4724 / KCTC 12464 / NCIMB 9791 / VKM B-1370 / CB 48) TaxID=573065 RepID=E8RPQ9_ASTEC|nr:phage tail tube protein [Asticcacaulis excentricus]ADU12036.1 major tail protein TP901-1 [Asticcacaulis excentricus CB 48]